MSRNLVSAVLFGLALISSAAFAQETTVRLRNCTSMEARRLATHAKNAQSDNLLEIDGVTSVGVGNCDPQWVAKVLNMRVPHVARPPVCGVSVGFETKEALEQFARAARVLGDETMVLAPNDDFLPVPVCGRLTGRIVPRGEE